MNLKIDAVQTSDDEWETAAIEQLRDDVRGYPGGARGFANDHKERLGIGYDAFNANLNGSGKIAYRTFARTVAILGYSAEDYDKRISARLEAGRNRK